MPDIRQQLKRIPSPSQLHRRCVALAVLDRIAGEEAPKFTMNAGRPGAFHHFKLDDGAGNTLSIVFSHEGTFLKGFDHESKMSPFAEGTLYPGLFHGFPPELRGFLLEPGLLGEEQEQRFPGTLADGEPPVALAPATFCAWWERSRSIWRCGELTFPSFDEYESDGAGFLLESLSPEWFEENYGWNPQFLQTVLEAHPPLEPERILALAPEANVHQVHTLMRQVGYGQAFPFAG